MTFLKSICQSSGKGKTLHWESVSFVLNNFPKGCSLLSAHQTKSWGLEVKTTFLPKERQSVNWRFLSISPVFIFLCLRNQSTRFSKVHVLKSCNSQQKIFPGTNSCPCNLLYLFFAGRNCSKKIHLFPVMEPDIPLFSEHLQRCCRGNSWGQMVCFLKTRVANVSMEAFAGRMSGYTGHIQWPCLQHSQVSSARGRANARVARGNLQQFPRHILFRAEHLRPACYGHDSGDGQSEP